MVVAHLRLVAPIDASTSGAGKTFVVPPAATRLYLGFVDASFFVGEPGFYANNRGALEASISFAME